MNQLKLTPKLLSDLKAKNLSIPVKTPLRSTKDSFDSYEKSNTTMSFKIRPCTPSETALLERKIDDSQSKRTTMTSLHKNKEDSIIKKEKKTLIDKEIDEEILLNIFKIESFQYLNITNLTLLVDLTMNSLQNLGNLLPNLRELKLNGSKMSSLRDIGSSLINLEVLWASRCGLNDLSGIMMFSKMKELYLSFNNIKDLSEICYQENLLILDLEGNNIEKFEDLEYLKGFENIVSLNLKGNPIEKLNKYREKTFEILDVLDLLDDKTKDFESNNELSDNNDDEKLENTKFMNKMLLKFQKYEKNIDITQIKARAEQMFDDEIEKELKDEDLIVFSMKKSPEKKDNLQRSDLVSTNDVAFSGNALKILKHKRNNQFTMEKETDILPKNICNILDEFRMDEDEESFVEDWNEESEILEKKEDNIIEIEKKPKIFHHEIIMSKRPEKINFKTLDEIKSAVSLRPKIFDISNWKINREKMKKNSAIIPNNNNLNHISQNIAKTDPIRLKIRQTIAKKQTIQPFFKEK